ncbi:hypothetical protein GCM10009434_29520 [Brevundimonas olei]
MLEIDSYVRTRLQRPAIEAEVAPASYAGIGNSPEGSIGFMLLPAGLSFLTIFAEIVTPNVPTTGSPLWGLVSWAVFIAGSRTFYAIGKWFERLERD